MKNLVFIIAVSISSSIAFAQTTLTDELSITMFLQANPAAQAYPSAIQLARGKSVKVTSIQYGECSTKDLLPIGMEISDPSGHTISTQLFIPCPKN